MRKKFGVLFFVAVGLGSLLRAVAADGLQPLDFSVDGVARTSLVYVPAAAKTNAAPLVFVFHGHTGTARQAARGFAIERHWPEAIVVYMQGLNTPGMITDPEGKFPGWQSAPGGQGDRDLKFFDAMLARLKRDYRVDTNRIYATGHSNGGGFTYLLWLTRGEIFAAIAPSAAAATYAKRLTPKPAMHVAGQDDPLVKFAWQKLTMNAVRGVNGCTTNGVAWDKQCTLYPSTNGAPLVTFIYPGGHEFNRAAPALIVKFFKQHPDGKK